MGWHNYCELKQNLMGKATKPTIPNQTKPNKSTKAFTATSKGNLQRKPAPGP